MAKTHIQMHPFPRTHPRTDPIKSPGRVSQIDIIVKCALTRKRSTDDGCLCSGLAQLLDGVAKDGSLNRAAKAMNMAYSKAWSLVGKAEQHFGFRLIANNGAGAGGSWLTAEGAVLLRIYQEMEEKIREFADEECQAALAKFKKTKRNLSSKQGGR